MGQYYAFSEDHQFQTGERVTVMFGVYPDGTLETGTVTNVTQRRVDVKLDSGEFRHYSTRNDNREIGSGRSQYTLQYTSHIIGTPAPSSCIGVSMDTPEPPEKEEEPLSLNSFEIYCIAVIVICLGILTSICVIGAIDGLVKH